MPRWRLAPQRPIRWWPWTKGWSPPPTAIFLTAPLHNPPQRLVNLFVGQYTGRPTWGWCPRWGKDGVLFIFSSSFSNSQSININVINKRLIGAHNLHRRPSLAPAAAGKLVGDVQQGEGEMSWCFYPRRLILILSFLFVLLIIQQQSTFGGSLRPNRQQHKNGEISICSVVLCFHVYHLICLLFTTNYHRGRGQGQCGRWGDYIHAKSILRGGDWAWMLEWNGRILKEVKG